MQLEVPYLLALMKSSYADDLDKYQIQKHDLHCRGFILYTVPSHSLSSPSCFCFVLICIHNGAVSSFPSRNTEVFFESSQKEKPSLLT